MVPKRGAPKTKGRAEAEENVEGRETTEQPRRSARSAAQSSGASSAPLADPSSGEAAERGTSGTSSRAKPKGEPKAKSSRAKVGGKDASSTSVAGKVSKPAARSSKKSKKTEEYDPPRFNYNWEPGPIVLSPELHNLMVKAERELLIECHGSLEDAVLEPIPIVADSSGGSKGNVRDGRACYMLCSRVRQPGASTSSTATEAEANLTTVNPKPPGEEAETNLMRVNPKPRGKEAVANTKGHPKPRGKKAAAPQATSLASPDPDSEKPDENPEGEQLPPMEQGHESEESEPFHELDEDPAEFSDQSLESASEEV